MKRPRKSTLIPLLLSVYLAIMSIIGLPELRMGHYAYYFGIIAVTLCCIVALHFFLKKREKMRYEREDDMRRRK